MNEQNETETQENTEYKANEPTTGPASDHSEPTTEHSAPDHSERLTMKIIAIATVCHEANTAYCRTIGDVTQQHWENAEDWQRESAIKGVEYRLNNPAAPASAQHDAWMQDKLDQGWVYGPVKDAEKKTHHCLVPYDELPEAQRKKDALFCAIVDALK